MARWTLDGSHGNRTTQWDEDLGVYVKIQPVKETDTEEVILELAWDGRRWSAAYFEECWRNRRNKHPSCE